MFRSTDKYLAWLHSYPELLSQASSFAEYCNLIKVAHPDQARLVDYYSSLTWLANQFPYAKRYPYNPLVSTLVFPAVDTPTDLLNNFEWVPFKERERTKSSTLNKIYICVYNVKSYKRNPGGGLYAQPTDLLRTWLDNAYEPHLSSLQLYERSDGVLLIWQASQIISHWWLAFFSVDKLSCIPWEKKDDSASKS